MINDSYISLKAAFDYLLKTIVRRGVRSHTPVKVRR